jgi:hypothetical protein
MNREQIVEQLKNNVCEVTFTKVNGDKRVMPCTLREDLLPPVLKQDPDADRKVNEKTVSVWVTDANGWRSFRVDSVIEVKVLDN